MTTANPKIATTFWTAAAITSPRSRRAALEEELSDSHIPWAVNSRGDSDLEFDLKISSLLDVDLIRVSCNAVSGFRSEIQLGQTDDAYIGVLVVDGGRERIQIGHDDVYMEPGMLVMWDSAMPMRFDVPDERMNKLTLLVPHGTMSAFFPQFLKFIGKPLDAQRGAGAIFTSHLKTLEREIGHVSCASAPALLQSTLETLAFAFKDDHQYADDSANSRMLLRRIYNYIERHLADPDLGPTRIAEAHRISTRYLHMLFGAESASVSKHILRRRLVRCAADLAAPALRHLSISDIAFEWGFHEASGFTRAFRQEFKVAPREYRQSVVSRSA